MLIVKDFEKLKAHGFERYSQMIHLWSYKLEQDARENYISLVVNPLFTQHKENELFVYASSGDTEFQDMDLCARIDILFEMLADGTIEYVKEDKSCQL